MKIFHRHPDSHNAVSCRSENFKNCFIPYIINERNESDPYELGSSSHNKIYYAVSMFILNSERKIYKINDTVETKLLKRR